MKGRDRIDLIAATAQVLETRRRSRRARRWSGHVGATDWPRSPSLRNDAYSPSGASLAILTRLLLSKHITEPLLSTRERVQRCRELGPHLVGEPFGRFERPGESLPRLVKCRETAHKIRRLAGRNKRVKRGPAYPHPPVAHPNGRQHAVVDVVPDCLLVETERRRDVFHSKERIFQRKNWVHHSTKRYN
jgi:hypothetical protein